MSRQLKAMILESFGWTLAILAALVLLIFLFWPSETRMEALLGLGWGAVTACIGFLMICTGTKTISSSVRTEKTKVFAAYAFRYGVYAVLLFSGAFLHFSILTMLAGILAQKASLLLYSWRSGKDCK